MTVYLNYHSEDDTLSQIALAYIHVMLFMHFPIFDVKVVNFIFIKTMDGSNCLSKLRRFLILMNIAAGKF